jgi:hypothetical protein
MMIYKISLAVKIMSFGWVNFKELCFGFVGFEMVFISKSLERIGDHAVSISKEIVFMATSKGVRHAEKYKKAALRKKLENS